MKLSMWILYDELSDYKTTSSVQDGELTIEDVRLFSPKCVCSNDYVYIGYSHDFFNDGNNDILLLHGHDKIVVENADFIELLNFIIAVFRKYQNWSKELYMAFTAVNPFQAILDIAHEAFQCPMFLGHKDLKIYAITRQYSSEDVYYEWDEVKELLTMPLGFLQRIKTKDKNRQYRGRKPIITPSFPEDDFKFPHQIRIDCFLNGQIWGDMYLYYKKPQISEGILQLARYVGDVFGELLSKSEIRIEEKYVKYASLVDLLDGKSVPESIITPLHFIQWREVSQLVLYKISTKTAETDVLPYDWLCDNISGHATNDIVFPYKGSIIVVSSINPNRPPVLLNYIKQVIALGDYHCGVSFAFERLYDIPSFFLQADYAIRYSKEPQHEKIHFFKDCMFDGIVQVFMNMCSWKYWTLPSLLSLVNEDKQAKSDNFKTLFVFLKNNCHIANTAKDLFIHRNTLIYRLKKIQQFLNVDIYNNAISVYLSFFCSLIAADDPSLLRPQPPIAGENIDSDSSDEKTASGNCAYEYNQNECMNKHE